jgi:transposase InsO family protein
VASFSSVAMASFSSVVDKLRTAHRRIRELETELVIVRQAAKEGCIYCAAVLDAFSRRIGGWSIDSKQDATLVVNALDLAIRNRRPAPGGVVHADHGTQGGFNWSSQHLVISEVFDGSSAARRGPGGAFGDEIAGGSSVAA